MKTRLGGGSGKESDKFGPEFAASYDGECSSNFCDDPEFEEGERIRADGQGGWICADCADSIIDEESEDEDEE